MLEGSHGERRPLAPKLDIVFWMPFGAEQKRALHAQPERLGVDDARRYGDGVSTLLGSGAALRSTTLAP